MISRHNFLERIKQGFAVNPVVALLGPRQCGKTTLAHQYAKAVGEETHFFDLENPTDLVALENAATVLGSLNGLIVIDEVQRRPELFPVLRVLVDRSERKKKFLILGSASRDLIRQSSETLAGRISHMELSPFNMTEVESMQDLWVRGGFPLSYTASETDISFRWRKEYIATYLERDIPSLGFDIPAAALRRFWMMLTHYHGQQFNASEIASSIGVTDKTVRKYLDLLAGTFMVRVLPPWFENIKKRQVKTPKIYFRDSGILHTFLEVADYGQLVKHPKLGASWEGFALEQVIRLKDPEGRNSYFWAVHRDGELDLLIFEKNRRIGYEIKFSEKPRVTSSMKMALEKLKLDQLNIITPGSKAFELSEKIQVVGLSVFAE